LVEQYNWGRKSYNVRRGLRGQHPNSPHHIRWFRKLMTVA